MKHLFLSLSLACLLFCSCENDASNNTNSGGDDMNNERNTQENVIENSHDQISPQLEGIEDTSRRLEVDTISSTHGAQQQKK